MRRRDQRRRRRRRRLSDARESVSYPQMSLPPLNTGPFFDSSFWGKSQKSTFHSLLRPLTRTKKKANETTTIYSGNSRPLLLPAFIATYVGCTRKKEKKNEAGPTIYVALAHAGAKKRKGAKILLFSYCFSPLKKRGELMSRALRPFSQRKKKVGLGEEIGKAKEVSFSGNRHLLFPRSMAIIRCSAAATLKKAHTHLLYRVSRSMIRKDIYLVLIVFCPICVLYIPLFSGWMLLLFSPRLKYV